MTGNTWCPVDTNNDALPDGIREKPVPVVKKPEKEDSLRFTQNKKADNSKSPKCGQREQRGFFQGGNRQKGG
jgi:hypothetical protein